MRVVFLGDSITDGGTYQLLIAQALKKAGMPSPALINAGIGGDTAKGARARLRRDVLTYQPTLVTLSIGINDTMRDVPMDEYQADVLSIIEQLRQEQVSLVLFTLTPIGPKHADKEESRQAKNAFLRETARRHGLMLVEIDAAMHEAQAASITVLEPDEIHITYAGYRVITRTILDTLGLPQVKLPETFTPELLPGLITSWQFKAIAGEPVQALTPDTVQTVQPNATWTALTLPLSTPQADWWPEQERQRGIATNLASVAGPAPAYLGHSSIHVEEAMEVYFSTGASLNAVWLNGECIYRFGGVYTGWHPGRERIPARLKAGDNTVIIECGNAFSLQVTPGRFW